MPTLSGSPAWPQGCDAAAASGDAEVMLKARHRGERILLAEDNPVNREVAEALLRAAGLVVESATNGHAAIDMALTRPYALMLMDIQMPGIDGLGATRVIRERLGRSLPIIAMTANTFAEDRADCLRAGMDDHIAKPVDPELMYATVLRWLPLPADADAASNGTAPFDRPDAHGQGALQRRLALIDGLDVNAALQNVGGQMAVLVRVLRRFVGLYRDGLPALLDTAGAEPGAVPAWCAACHSLRGALAVIGARQLTREVEVLEMELHPLRTRASVALGAKVHDGLKVLVDKIARAVA